MAINRSLGVGSSKLTNDWIELHNPGQEGIQLKDYYLTDDPEDLTKYQIGNLFVAPSGFVGLIKSDDDNIGAKEIPFSLSGEGEFIALVAPDGITVIDSISFGQQYPDQAFGRDENGGDWGFLDSPTFGTSNPKLKALLPQVSFALPPGIYQEDSLRVEIWSNHPEAKIYYSINGTEPDTTARLYDGPILLKKSQTIRAKAILDSAESLVSSYASYFLQSPKDHYILNLHAPQSWFYNSDTAILSISKYEITNWDSQIEAFNYLIDAELYSPDGVLISKHQGRLKQHGAGSTYGIQKSLRLHLSPSQAITEPIYRQKPHIESHRVLILRQGGNSSDWTGLSIQDVLSSEYLSRKDWDLDYQAYQPVNVYINGRFHALMFFRERHDEHYYANNFDADPEKVTVLRKWGYGSETDTGDDQNYYSLTSFIQSNNFRDTANIRLLAERMDLDNYFKYLYFNDYISNYDWPYNNYKMANAGGENDKWRFCIYDTDFGYQNGQAHGIATLMSSGDQEFFLPVILKNDSLREYFVNYYLDLLNTELEPAGFSNSLDYIKQYLGQDLQDHLDHWLPKLQGSGGFIQDWDQYFSELQKNLSVRNRDARVGLIKGFGLGRVVDLTFQVSPSSAGHIKLNSLDLQEFPWSGKYLNRNPVQITAIPRPGYRFAGWTDPLLPDTNVLRHDFETSCTLTAIFEPDPDYQPQLVINEIMYADIPNRGGGDWLELYNASESEIDLSQWVLGDEKLANRFSFPPGTIISAKQFLVVSRDPSAFLGAFPNTEIVPKALGFGLGRTDVVKIWNPQGVLYDSVSYNNQAPWPLIADAQGASLALRDPQLKINHPQSWINRTSYFPTPGRANELITEIDIINRLSCIRFNAEIFPNPIESEMNLYFANSESESIQLQFLDLLGREVYAQELGLRLGANLVQVPLDFLPQGHYILRMEQDGMVETTRIVKN